MMSRANSEWLVRSQRCWPLAVLAAAIPVLLILRANPGVYHCPWLAMTGCPCPLCGGTRSAQSLLLDGSLTEALHWHPVVPVAMGLAILQAITGAVRPHQPAPRWLTAWTVLGTVTLVWWISARVL